VQRATFTLTSHHNLTYSMFLAADRIRRMLAKVKEFTTEPAGGWPTPEVVPSFVTIPMALACAIAAVVILNAAIRSAKSYWLCVAPPGWAMVEKGPGVQLLCPPGWIRGLLHINAILPPLVALAWFDPVGQAIADLADFTTGRKNVLSLEYIRGGLFLFWALSMMVVARPLLQSYLNGALVTWYEMKEDARAERDHQRDALMGKKYRERIRACNEYINHYLGHKSALLVVPSCVIACLAILYLELGSAARERVADVRGIHLEDPVVRFLPVSSECIDAFFLFVGFMIASIWATLTMLAISLYKTGVMEHAEFKARG